MILDEIFFSVPDAVKRLGKSVFLETPLYKSKKPYKFIYINEDLFLTLFKLEERISWQEMKESLECYFNSTIEPALGTGEVISMAYVDRQFDPLNISLSGNLGSGRAYYAGKYFNIKGEKTPLAISPVEKYSNGFLEMERGIWETWISNSLQESLTTKLCKVLAILDIDESCCVPWRSHPVKRVKIIRLDQEGELDRVTHYFYSQTPLSASTLENAAKFYGKLEADKFIERILHGAWSPGNISLKGHFIDFDSVVATKGRAPQYSFTQWHHQNYFGYEFKGQLNVLKTLCDHQNVNKDKIDYSHLKEIFSKSLKNQCAQGFVKLMGFEQAEIIFIKYQTQLLSLCKEFTQLSRKCIPDSKALFAKNFESLFHYFFDFSAFFRVYPILKRHELFSKEKALIIGLTSVDPFEITAMTIENLSSEDKKYLLNEIHKYFEHDFISDLETYEKTREDILNFIILYDQIFSEIISWTKEDLCKVEANAYKINEDRFYLFAPFTLSYSFSLNSINESEKTLQKLIQLVIEANNRFLAYNYNDYTCNYRIYHEGYYFTQLNDSGMHQHNFTIFKEKLTNINLNLAKIIINDEILLLKNEEKDDYIRFSSDFIENDFLLKNYNDLSVLENRDIVIKDENHLITFVQYK